MRTARRRRRNSGPSRLRPTNCSHRRLTVIDRSRRGADQVDVLRVAQWCREVKLVQRRSTANPQRATQHVIAEHLYQRPANHQILPDLPRIRPRNHVAPRDDVLRGDQTSGSGKRRTTTRHLASRNTGSAAKSGSAAPRRSSSVQRTVPSDRNRPSIGPVKSSSPLIRSSRQPSLCTTGRSTPVRIRLAPRVLGKRGRQQPSVVAGADRRRG